MFEQALRRNKYRWKYEKNPSDIFSPDVDAGKLISICKPHGSINWFPGQSEIFHQVQRGYPSDQITNIVFGENGRSSNLPSTYATRDDLICQKLAADDYNWPIMAQYSTQKYSYQNSNFIEANRIKSIEWAKNTKKATIIGLHFISKKDDQTLYEIFKALKEKNVEYVNPDSSECRKITKKFNFTCETKDFEHWLLPTE